MQLGDVNGDGIPDIIFGGIGGLEVLLGDGTGNFTVRQVIPVGDCYALTIGDLNGDGKLDVVVGSSGLYRLFGKGDGTFLLPIAIPEVYSRPARMQIADFNGDGHADLAVSGVSNFYIYYGNGKGSLSTPQVYTVGGPVAGELATGHFRSGDQLDVVVNDFFGLSVLFSTPHGFEDSVDTPVPLYPTSMSSADFNGDGLTDLVVTGASEFQVFFGTCKASKPFVAGPVTTLAGGERVAAADFDGDGNQDVVVSTYDSQANIIGFYVCLGNGDGTFRAPMLILSGSMSDVGVTTGDLNGDGKPDIAINSFGYSFNNGEGTNILFGNGDGTFQPAVSLGTPGSHDIGLADFNNDGLPDIYSGDLTGENAIVFLNQGGGKFSPAMVVNDEGGNGGGPIACDVNRDGNMDLVASGNFNPNVNLGNGQGGFGNPIHIDKIPSLELEIGSVCGSFTGTSYPELAVISEAYNLAQILVNTGKGTFVPAQNAWGTGPAPIAILAGKFHGQKQLDDLVVLNSGLATFTVLLNLTQPK